MAWDEADTGILNRWEKKRVHGELMCRMGKEKLCICTAGEESREAVTARTNRKIRAKVLR